jgi:hypothetical protein
MDPLALTPELGWSRGTDGVVHLGKPNPAPLPAKQLQKSCASPRPSGERESGQFRDKAVTNKSPRSTPGRDEHAAAPERELLTSLPGLQPGERFGDRMKPLDFEARAGLMAGLPRASRNATRSP